MIGRLKGILLEKTPLHLLIDVAGVGYEVSVPMFTFYRLPEIGEEVVLLTHFVVREDAQLLFGFSHEQERTLFRHLIKVSAIGPKLALSILSGIEPHQFVHCVLHNDTASLVRIPGIGKKTAERLVIEMRDRLEDWHSLPVTSTQIKTTLATLSNDPKQEAISALIALGYKPSEAKNAISHLEGNFTSEELIRGALRNMMKGVSHAT